MTGYMYREFWVSSNETGTWWVANNKFQRSFEGESAAAVTALIDRYYNKEIPTCPGGWHFDTTVNRCVYDVPSLEPTAPPPYYEEPTTPPVTPTIPTYYEEPTPPPHQELDIRDYCFIATACGTSNPSLSTLRMFRDECMPDPLVRSYYRLSPGLAAFISEHQNLKTVGKRFWEWLARQLQRIIWGDA